MLKTLLPIASFPPQLGHCNVTKSLMEKPP
jgi:hypothetical protein